MLIRPMHDADTDVTPQAGAVADATATPPAAQPAAPPPATTPADDETSERTYSAAEVRALKNEAKNLRARLREVEAQAAGHPAALEAATRDAEALRGQVASLSDRLRAYVLRDAISEAGRDDEAGDLRGVNADLAARLIEGVEWGDDGAPKGVAPALRKLIKRYPEIAAATPARPAQPPAGGGQARATLAQADERTRAEKRTIIGAI